MRGQELGVGQGGVWTRRDARTAGFSATGVQRACTSGAWQVVRRGVYTDAGVSLAATHRAWAAVLSAGGPGHAVAAGRTAARMHGLPLVDDDDPATGRLESVHDDVAVARALGDTATLHPRVWLYAAEELGTIAGCPVPSLARTLWDLRLVLREDALVCALDAALHSGRVTAAQLAAQARPGARTSRAYERARHLADGRAESPLETLARLVLAPVVPGLVPQVQVRDRGGRLLARVDLGEEELRLGIEADGRTHRGDLSLARDRERERRTGWSFERVTWWDVRCGQEALRVRVRDRAHGLLCRRDRP